MVVAECVGAGLVVVVVAKVEVEVEVVAPDPDPVLDADADAAIAESVESLLGSVRGITNDVDADADAEGGVNVRGKGVVMGGGGCACAAIAVLCSRVYGHAREMWEVKRIEGGEERPAGECVSESFPDPSRVERRAGGKGGGGLDEIRIV